jgi:hypothetical protein
MLRLTLYSRGYCHLCHEMQAQLEALRGDFAFEIEVVDVDRDPVLEQRFGEDVPVLLHDGAELARHRMDGDAIRAYLRKQG